MNDIISAAKAEFSKAQARMTQCLVATPDEKVNWSPSPTSRTPIQLVAHAAMGTQGMSGVLQGHPFPFADFAEMDVTMRANEKLITSREAALALLESTSKDFLAWLDTLTAEQLTESAQSPFPPIPLASAITFAADHIRGHSAQFEYLQTIYGDMEFRM